MQKTVSIAIKNCKEEIEKIIIALEEFGEKHQLSIKVINVLNMAVDELVSNAVFYGYDKNQNGIIIVHAKIKDDYVHLTIEDDGKKFNPLVDAPEPNLGKENIEEMIPGGLGIHIVKKQTDSIDYQRKENKNIIKIKINKNKS